MKELIAIQQELKAPKNQFNSFGKYNYRSCEDILEAVKPLLAKQKCSMLIADSTKEVGGIVFIEAMVELRNSNGDIVKVTAQAGVDPNRKGMDIAQCFGASSSYARKYALNGLFLIDDTKDADATNDHGKGETSKSKPKKEERDYEKELRACKTLDELAALYKSIPDWKKYEAVKDEMKSLLEDDLPF